MSEFLVFLFGLVALLRLIMPHLAYRADLKSASPTRALGIPSVAQWHSALLHPSSFLREVITDTNKLPWIVWECANLKWHCICSGVEHIYGQLPALLGFL